MKPAETIRHLEFRNLAALVICCGLAVFIGFMLTGQYLTHAEVEQSRAKTLAQDLDKRVTAVGYFFSERVADLQTLGQSRELLGYFENQALGMSMRYGLKSSLYAAARRFTLVRESKRIRTDAIYRRLVFITKTGDILIDTQGAPDQFPRFAAHLLSPLPKDPETNGKWTAEHRGQVLGDGTEIAVWHPFYFKGRRFGTLVSFLDPSAIDRNLVRQAGDPGRYFCLAYGNDPLFLPGNTLMEIPDKGRIELKTLPHGEIRMIRSGTLSEKGLLALRMAVPDTPFSVVTLARTDVMSESSVYAIFGAFVLFLATAIFFIWRTATQRLIVGVQLNESRQSEARFRDLVEFLPVPIAEYGFDFKIRYVNQSAVDFFGYTREEIAAGVEIMDIVPEGGQEESRSRIQILSKGENPGPLEMWLKKKNSQAVWGKIIPSIIYEKGRPSGIRTCFLDMTAQRQSQQEARQAAEQEKFALVGQVAGKMAHDFNNILSAIMGNTELSLLDCKDPDMARTLKIILEQSKRGHILTQNLVAFAKDQEIKEEYFGINDKLDLVLNLLKKELEGIRVEKDFQEQMPELMADPGMIEHALVNLIQNAVHAMARTEDPRLFLETRADETALTIRVGDNGCGIPEAYADQIYSPAFSLKGSRDYTKAYGPKIKGTGYGLSNVKKYIDQHKGSISFDSREGRGTVFTVTLPLIARDLFPDEKADLLKRPVVRDKHILVVEDEEAISQVLCKILSSDPFFHRVTLARTGEEALDLLDLELAGQGTAVDLVSLDYMLPGQVNGLEVYNRIRSMSKDLPVLFISGNIRFLESMATIQAKDGFADHLSKPFENILYADKVNAWLQAARPSFHREIP